MSSGDGPCCILFSPGCFLFMLFFIQSMLFFIQSTFRPEQHQLCLNTENFYFFLFLIPNIQHLILQCIVWIRYIFIIQFHSLHLGVVIMYMHHQNDKHSHKKELENCLHTLSEICFTTQLKEISFR